MSAELKRFIDDREYDGVNLFAANTATCWGVSCRHHGRDGVVVMDGVTQEEAIASWNRRRGGT